MKQLLINFLNRLGLYYRLQYLYRNSIITTQQFFIKQQYRSKKGTGYTCNFCGAQYKEFVPEHPGEEDRGAIEKNQVIAGYGENVFCPNCFSTNRERLVLAVLQSRINITGKTILHFAPERKVYEWLRTKATVITADLETGFYKVIDKNIRCENITKLSFSNGTFDVVIANHVLEHVPNDTAAMKEIYRVLKPGGMAVLQVPFSNTHIQTIEEPAIKNPAQQSALFGQKDHVRIYALQDYINRLKHAGFKVTCLDYDDLVEFKKNATQEGEGFLMITK
ncbi:MAG: methyltransferase domain-containing protein [Panacibacter sp.]